MCHQLTAYKVTTVIKWIIVSTWTRQESTTKGTYSRLDMLNFTPAERERECFKDRDAYKGNLETEWGNTGVFNGSHALWDVSSRLKLLRGVSTSGSHVVSLHQEASRWSQGEGSPFAAELFHESCLYLRLMFDSLFFRTFL